MKAVLKNGMIVPREPLPKDWKEGVELAVEKAFPEINLTDTEIDEIFVRINADAEHMTPEDEIILEQTIREVRAEAREIARKEAEKSNGPIPD